MQIIHSARLEDIKIIGKKIIFTTVLLRNNKIYQTLKRTEVAIGDTITIEGILVQNISEDIVEAIMDKYKE